MRRATALLAVVVAVLVVALVARGLARASDDDGYRVRAVFDNASFVIPGEDVKVAGVKVGRVLALDLTADRKAVVVLRIDDPAFVPFRRDAHCTVRPQSLIGEQFVECVPTTSRAGGALPPPLPALASGRGEGEHLLTVAHTTTPVALDLVTDTLRLPWRQRLTLIINELGAGLAGNAENLSATIRRADPALAQTDRVLGLLAGQNRTLGRLVEESDRVVAPLAARRTRIAHSIGATADTARAAAAQGGDLEQDLALFPAFLRRLRPTVDQLGTTADQVTPALAALRPHAAELGRFVRGAGPLAQAATPAVRTLGQASVVGRRALVAARPTVGDLRTLARGLVPAAANLAAVGTSFERAGGIPSALATILNSVGASNGYDRFGHYLRAALVVNNCESYAAEPVEQCTSKFARINGATTAPGPRTVASGPTSPGAVDRGLLDYLLGPGR